MKRYEFIKKLSSDFSKYSPSDAIQLACELADMELDNPDTYWLEQGICPSCQESNWLMPIDTDFFEYVCLNCGEKYVTVE